MGAGFIFGYDIIFLEKNQWIRATILTLSHTIWSMILFWIILASISRYNLGLRNILKCKCFQILGKLSNCTFFIGPLVIKVFFLCSESASNTSTGYMVRLFLFKNIIIFGLFVSDNFIFWICDCYLHDFVYFIHII